MLMKFALPVILFASLFTNCAFAGTTSGAHIVTLAIDDGAPNVLFIIVDVPKDSQASCQQNGTWAYVRPLVSQQDKNIYAMLLAAKTTQTPIKLIGTTNCLVYPGIETLQAVYY